MFGRHPRGWRECNWFNKGWILATKSSHYSSLTTMFVSRSFSKIFGNTLIGFKIGFGSNLKGLKIGLEAIQEVEKGVIISIKVGIWLESAKTTEFGP